MMDRFIMIRRQCAIDNGIILPSLRIRDNIRLGANEYRFMIKGTEVAKGEVMPGPLPCHKLRGHGGDYIGHRNCRTDLWLTGSVDNQKQREKAELLGYTTIDPPSVITTHLMEVIKNHAAELINRQQVQTLIENLAQTQPALVEEVVPRLFSYGEIQRVLVRLLREGVPIKNFATIIETLADYGNLTKNTDDLNRICPPEPVQSYNRAFYKQR